MNKNEIHLHECIGILKAIIQLWPKVSRSPGEAPNPSLAAFLAEEFGAVDLQNAIGCVAEIAGVETWKDRTQIDFYDADGCKHRAVFISDEQRRWLLLSLKFQCPVCFGEGINDDDVCDMCGGSGWGVA